MADMAAGDSQAGLSGVERDATLSALHREHYRSLVRLACVLLDEQGAGEEVVQEAFVRVHRSWAQVDQPLTYLRATVLNLSRSRMRRRLVARRRVEPVVRPAMSAEEHVVLLSDQQEVLDAVRALAASPARVPGAPVLPRALRSRDRRDARHLERIGEVAFASRPEGTRDAVGGTDMKIEERLHDAMHEYADTIEPEPGSWSRIVRPLRRGAGAVAHPARFARLRRCCARAGRRARRGARRARRPATARGSRPGPAAGMPSRILAVNEDGHATVLDSTTGSSRAGSTRRRSWPREPRSR